MSKTRRSRRRTNSQPRDRRPPDTHRVLQDGYHRCSCGSIMLFEPTNPGEPPYCPSCSEEELSTLTTSLNPLRRLIARDRDVAAGKRRGPASAEAVALVAGGCRPTEALQMAAVKGHLNEKFGRAVIR